MTRTERLVIEHTVGVPPESPALDTPEKRRDYAIRMMNATVKRLCEDRLARLKSEAKARGRLCR